ncbi:MAG: M48 family metalloprotease [Vicinamibacteraceae bacterium]
MKGLTTRIVIAVVGLGVLASPAAAQFDKIGKGLAVAKKANDAIYTEAEKQQLGAEVSANIRKKFGVVQDPAVHRYVALVGGVLTRVSKKPDYPWRFIVLDTDAVNAFAAPGGYVHITKGCLALIANESELAGVLGHELTHVVEDHTVKALSKAGFVDTAASASGKGGDITAGLVNQVTSIALQGFGRGEELESDHDGLNLAAKAGYQPDGLRTFLQRLTDRNKNSSEKRGMFASHPAMQERLDKLASQEKKEKPSTVTLEARFTQFISYKPVPQSQIATVAAGSSGLASGGGSSKKADDKDSKKEEEKPKKKGFGLGRLADSLGGGEKKSGQTVASGGARGLDPEVDAKGGPNPGVVSVTVSRSDIDAFRKEGKLA